MTARVPRSKWTVVVLNQAKEGAGAMNDCSIHRNNDWNDEVEHECCCANDHVDGPVPILVQEQFRYLVDLEWAGLRRCYPKKILG